MKKVLILLFAVFVLLIAAVGGSVYAEPLGGGVKSEILLDYYTGNVLHEKNADEKLPIASMVKIMTALIAFEEIDAGRMTLEQKVVISDTAAGMGGSQMFLESGDEYTISDLLKGVIVVSANDASVQLAEVISGSEQEFVQIMNEKAKSLGMANTVFVNATGLPKNGQYSTARDVAIMLKELSKHEKYYDFSRIWMEEYKHPDGRTTEFVNTNKLIRFNKDCEGGKTGYTSEAKFCLAATAKRDNTRLISVVIGADSSKLRFSRATEMLNAAFAKYVNSCVLSKTVAVGQGVSVLGGSKNNISVYPQSDFYILREKTKPIDFKIDYKINEAMRAPIKKGTVVGRATVLVGEEKHEINLIAGEDVGAISYKDALLGVLRDW